MSINKKIFVSLLCLFLLILIPVYGFADISCSDDLSGVTYSLPSGWSKADFNTPKEFLSAKYKNGDSLIMFGSMDMWEMLDETSKQEYASRASLDNYALSDEDWEVLSGLGNGNDELSIYKKTYSGNEYVMIDATANYTIAGYSVNAVGHYAYIVKNGYIICFQLQEVGGSDYYDDFEYVLRSASYDSVKGGTSMYSDRSAFETVPSAVPTQSTAQKSPDSSNNSSGVIWAIIIILSIIGISIYFSCRKQKENSPDNSANRAPAKSITIESVPDVIRSESSRKMVKCSKCDYVGSIDADDAYDRYKCPKCFSRLVSMEIDKATYYQHKNTLSNVASSVTEEITDTSVGRFCPYCGKEIIPGSRFCKYCGSKLNS